MLFHSREFFVFLPAVLALFYCSPRWLRSWILLAASYGFYAWWNYKFLLLLCGLTIGDYLCALVIERKKSKIALCLGVMANLCFLGFFKYYNFFAATFAQLLSKPDKTFWMEIVLPVGISFHTFQSISYLVDVYRGELRAERNLLHYALYLAFFPQLVAGPIVRARDFLRDLHFWHAPSRDEVLRGALEIFTGLAKKMVLADQFALISDAYFASPSAHPGILPAWSASIAFSLQIFFDFSGYTDMAIGIALLFGFHFPENFRRPYLASSVTEFWRRWHISLSSWLRDYLYIPRGGNRGGQWNTYRNLILTMLLGGLWHGASWNFVIWGGYHGTLLAIEKRSGLRIGVPLTFVLVLFGWVFFRAASFQDAAFIFGQMFRGARFLQWKLPVWLMLLTAASLILAVLEERKAFFERPFEWPRFCYPALLFSLLLLIELFGVTDVSVPFVYFQF